ncbi:MAG: hypothetical protein JW741_20195 [Sedimentisphaerales bacterium]|nr:hypothetical protein [Sedimentisphaerales bacterium]
MSIDQSACESVPESCTHLRLPYALLALTVCVWLGAGCSYRPVNTADVLSDPGVRRIDPDDGPFVIEVEQQTSEDGSEPQTVHTVKWKPTRVRLNMPEGRTFNLRYRPLHFCLSSHPAVDVEMPGGKRYAALLDTGYTGTVYVNDQVVRGSDLAVFPLGSHSETGCTTGYCEIPVMKLGDATIHNPRCVYEQRQWQLRVLGVPLYRHQMVLLGLDLMRQFAYVLFDNAGRQVVFSPFDPFDPGDDGKWVSHPFALESVAGEVRLMTDISLGSGNIHVEFDTCGGKPDLLLRHDTWQRVSSGADARGGSKKLHQSYQYGWHWCRQYTLPSVQIGPFALENIKANVLPDESRFGQDYEGILSLHCLRETAVVLDFKKNLLWMRQ